MATTGRVLEGGMMWAFRTDVQSTGVRLRRMAGPDEMKPGRQALLRVRLSSGTGFTRGRAWTTWANGRDRALGAQPSGVRRTADFQRALILAIRDACLPPSNFADKNELTMSMAVPGPTTRAPRHKAFASLCCRARRALRGSLHTTARTEGWRLAAMAMPTPVPQTRMASSASRLASARPTAWAKSG